MQARTPPFVHLRHLLCKAFAQLFVLSPGKGIFAKIYGEIFGGGIVPFAGLGNRNRR